VEEVERIVVPLAAIGVIVWAVVVSAWASSRAEVWRIMVASCKNAFGCAPL
jgi:hypothetical protein